jgi:hypothetical protein
VFAVNVLLMISREAPFLKTVGRTVIYRKDKSDW